MYKSYIYYCKNCKFGLVDFYFTLGYLRLACIARDRGQLRDASIWIKQALDVDPVSLVYLNKYLNIIITLILGFYFTYKIRFRGFLFVHIKIHFLCFKSKEFI